MLSSTDLPLSEMNDHERARFNMIEQQIRPWDVLEPRVLELLWKVRREDFVPAAHRALAFVDMELPLAGSHEQSLRDGRCMLPPRVEARMVQEADPKPHEKVLEVGAGSGHVAALLAGLAGQVVTLDIDPEMAALARANLERAGIANVQVREADGAHGAPQDGPFDVIVLSGSVAQLPEHLLPQLRIGGRLVAIVGSEPIMRATLLTRTGESSRTVAQRWDTLAPRLRNFPEPSRFSF